MCGVLFIMIDYSQVIDVDVEKCTFIMRDGYGNKCHIPNINIIEVSQTAFNQHIFLYKKFLKQQKNPDDRVAPFECKNIHGVFSLDKYRRVFNSRLKPGEEDEFFGQGDTFLKC